MSEPRKFAEGTDISAERSRSCLLGPGKEP